jgi:hypothetical protein
MSGEDEAWKGAWAVISYEISGSWDVFKGKTR